MSNCINCNATLTWENKTLCVKCGVEICEDCSVRNKFKCDKCFDKSKIKIPDVIRRSSIEDYKSCPYYFKLHVIDGNEPDQNVLARLGSDLHDLYEQVQRNDVSVDEIAPKTLIIIDEIIKDYPDTDQDRLVERAETSNTSFIKLLPTLTNEAIAFEERIYFSIGKDLPKVTIAYDRLEKDEN